MTRFIPVIILLWFASCAERNKVYQPNSEEIKSFFEQLDDSALTKRQFLLINEVQRKWKDLFIRTASHQKDLSKNDIDFIADQFDIRQPAVWTNAIFDSARIVSNTYIPSFYRQTGVYPIYYRFSYPYFSKNKMYCIIYYDYYCGSLCAEESIRLYKRENGKWILIKTLYSIVS